MRKLHRQAAQAAFVALAALPLASAPALASSFAGTSAGTSAGGTSASSGSTSGDEKIVLQARDDAACFVASDGAIRGAMLEAALAALREHQPALREHSDRALAQAILAR
ncbi:MAG: DUF2388 domain-containing protein [Luteimonas sp.]